MEKILVLNSGSSTLKCQLFTMYDDYCEVIAKGLAERIGLSDSRIAITFKDHPPVIRHLPLPDHEVVLKEVLDILQHTVLHDISELSAVGHRLGHGGEFFNRSVIIDEQVMQKINDTMELLPLHGAAFVHGINAITHLLPKISQVAVFDTAFHQTMPKEAYLYSLPSEQYEKHRIRRYGFHGTSHRYVSEMAADILGFNGRFISCHLGNGASVTAIRDGQSVDTSMGFTPAAGIMMGTRCGDIDPYIPLYIMKHQNKTADEVNAMMNKESGLFGASGGFSDVRDLEKRCLQGDSKAITAVDMYVYNIIKYIGAYAAVLDGIDALIFTAGIGENSSFIRKKICDRLGYLGIKLDENANHRRGERAVVSAPDSPVKVLVIPTNEEYIIARDTYDLITNRRRKKSFRVA